MYIYIYISIVSIRPNRLKFSHWLSKGRVKPFSLMQHSPNRQGPIIGALITRTGFCGFLYNYRHNIPQDPILMIKAPILTRKRSNATAAQPSKLVQSRRGNP